MTSLRWETDIPELRSPILVCAFRGWNDAAASATTALGAVAASLDTVPIAEIDPEEFFDFQVNRPMISLVDGKTRQIDWPQNDIVAALAPDASRDLILLDGTEPNLRWRTFTDAIIEVIERFGVQRVVTLGALIAEVAHTLPVPVTGLASDEELIAELDLRRSDYEGPTGITGVLHDACQGLGIPSASLWAAVPHYVAAVPNPKAALALLIRLEALTGVVVDTSELEDDCHDYKDQVDRAIAANAEIGDLVERIEAEQTEMLEDEIEEADELEIPTAETLASEFQRFLQERND